MPATRARAETALSERPERAYRTRYHATWVLPITSPPIVNGTVVVEGDRIAWVGPRERAPDGRDVELGESLLLPGLVNAHTHLDLTAMRGVLHGMPFFAWVRALVALREELTAAELLDSARLGILEGLRAGITTYADTAPNEAPFEAMRELGVRGIAYREVFGPDPARCEDAMGELRATVTALRARETPLARVGVSPHAPYSVSDALFRAAAGLARREGLPLATHVGESDDESRLVERGEGEFAAFLRDRGLAVGARARSPIALLEQCEVLARNTLLIHCVRCDAMDVATIARHRASVAHCPASNAWFGHGIAPVGELLAAGVRVGLGTDSMASNERMGLLDEARRALTEQRARGRAECDARTVLELATIAGARSLALEREVGSLERGKQADLAAFPLPRGGARARDPDDALVAALAGARASLVVVAGRVLVRDGHTLAPDDGCADRVTAVTTRLSASRRAVAARWRPPPPFH